jgi:hypothetical protein
METVNVSGLLQSSDRHYALGSELCQPTGLIDGASIFIKQEKAVN